MTGDEAPSPLVLFTHAIVLGNNDAVIHINFVCKIFILNIRVTVISSTSSVRHIFSV